jgi:hypothetical protein
MYEEVQNRTEEIVTSKLKRNTNNWEIVELIYAQARQK